MAYCSQADELFYGGAAGGGKTDLLLGLALTEHRKSIIFRREYPQLKDIIERSRELIGLNGRYNDTAHIWRGLPGNRSIEFGALQYEADKEKYKGRPHDFMAYDEMSDMTESQYTFTSGWLRTTVPDQRVQSVGAGNPPTNADGEWVIRRWGPWLDDQHPRPAKPGELRWFAMIDKKDTEVDGPKLIIFKQDEITPRSRTFIPARLTDNPYLLNSGYGTVLQNMPEPLRSQLLYGDFKAGIKDDPWQTIPTAWIKAAQARWHEGDFGPQSCIGVDVARGGDDKTVIAIRHGHWFAPLLKYEGKDTPDGNYVAGLVLAAKKGNPIINIDVIGVGSSPYDILKNMGQVAGINFGEGTSATDKSGRLRFANVRACAYWKFREALDPVNDSNIALPPDSELLADLAAPKWSPRGEKITIESKEEIKKRLGRSPDCGDAVVLAYYSKILEGQLVY